MAATSKTLGGHSHVVRPAEMEWKKTRFPGCEVKGLLLDKQTGLVTALMRLAPGAVLPDHEHVKIEQTYMLEGKLVDKEGPVAGLSVGPGEFVWREAGTRHVAWTPEGGLMLQQILRGRRPRHRHIRRRLGQHLGPRVRGLVGLSVIGARLMPIHRFLARSSNRPRAHRQNVTRALNHLQRAERDKDAR